MALLTVNAGSSNIKLARYDGANDGTLRRTGSGKAFIGNGRVDMVVETADGARELLREGDFDADAAPEVVLGLVDEVWPLVRLDAVGHRIVHGGPHYREPVMMDDEAIGRLRHLCPLAPLHQPANLAFVDAVRARAPALPQVACFDTGFHADLPEHVWRFALPRRVDAFDVRRYGFHGLSYQWIAESLRERAPDLAAGRVVVAHLGSGASLCALRDGRSVDTSMGFSALDGVPMATRCGALDPGVVLHLIQRLGLSPAAVERMLYRESGLLGLSGESGDTRALLASGSDAARQALEIFAYRVAGGIASLSVALGGLDGVVFTAGIGENQPPVRAQVAQWLAPFAARVDDARNQASDGAFHAADSGVQLWVLPTDEEAVIARAVRRLVGTGS